MALRSIIFILLSINIGTADAQLSTQMSKQEAEVTIHHFYELFKEDPVRTKIAIEYIETTWKEEYISMLLDIAYITNSRTISSEALRILREKTGKKYYRNIFKWLEWRWNEDQKIIPLYADWLALIYQNLDPKFDKYFRGRTEDALIRLDEIRWGGVVQDGIPPLRKPKMIAAQEADYLGNKDIVFGIEINGDARAYPKRILAWHEMFVDVIGGESIAGVYCTLCGTVIAYNTQHGGVDHELGTSGFLYRSNKLMYDKATQSLWNTIEGKPVLGPLTNQGIVLKSNSVVTTTWKEWKRLHPDTKVLSLKTGHQRNYDEGAAYARYFRTDELMFNVPHKDKRLKNKDEVLIIRAQGYQKNPLAISKKFLSKNKVYHDKIYETNIVVLTDESHANRAYDSENTIFVRYLEDTIIDNQNNVWKITEEKLISETGEELLRLPYHRIFWFAWFNTYQDTRLVK